MVFAQHVDGMTGILDSLRGQLPIRPIVYDLTDRRCGLVIIDEVNGFVTVGAGALAPRSANPQVSQMVSETDRLAKWFSESSRPIAAFLDTHTPGKPEPPYPPHCEQGSGEEDLVEKLKWLQTCQHVTVFRKDCINGFVGAHDPNTGENSFVSWVNHHELNTLIFTGICTDICVMDFVLTVLSARNHGVTPKMHDVVVYEPACSTYDMPRDVAESAGLPVTAAHPQALTHHLGLYFMASRGAILASQLT